MNWYIVKSQIFTIYLSLAHLTAVTFPEKVQDYVGGRKGEFVIHQLNQGKTLVFEPKKTVIHRNVVVFTVGHKFHFNLIHHPRRSVKDVNLHPGRPCSRLILLRETKQWQLFECPRSLYIVNRTLRPLFVNERYVRDKAFLSKGPPLTINRRPIHYIGGSP